MIKNNVFIIEIILFEYTHFSGGRKYLESQKNSNNNEKKQNKR